MTDKPHPKRTVSATTVLRKEQQWHARWFHLVVWFLLVVLAVVFLHAVKPILLPFVLGGLIAYLASPLAESLQKFGVHRGVAAAGITLLLFAALIGLIAWLGPLLYHQIVELATRSPELVHRVEAALRDETNPFFRTINRFKDPEGGTPLPNNIDELMQNAMTSIGGVFSRVLGSAASALNVIALLLITPIVCFYFIRDWTGVISRTDALLPRAYAPVIREQLRAINQTLAAYLRGQLTVMLLLAVFYAVIFSVLGINYAILLGLLAGLLVIIPYLGTAMSIALGLTVAYGQFGLTTPFWIMVGIYLFGQSVESQILTPKIVGDRVGVHPLWLLFGMLAGGVLLGFVGVLLSVPLTAVISVLVKFVLDRYLHSSLYTER